jgi:hypothetical protein
MRVFKLAAALAAALSVTACCGLGDRGCPQDRAALPAPASIPSN